MFVTAVVTPFGARALMRLLPLEAHVRLFSEGYRLFRAACPSLAHGAAVALDPVGKLVHRLLVSAAAACLHCWLDRQAQEKRPQLSRGATGAIFGASLRLWPPMYARLNAFWLRNIYGHRVTSIQSGLVSHVANRFEAAAACIAILVMLLLGGK